MIIYLSGPMTGLPNLNFEEFNKMANYLRGGGIEVINPAEVVPQEDSWEGFMRADIRELMRADKVAVLSGWEKSRGARLEVAIAAALNIEIVNAYTLRPIKVGSSLDMYIGEQERGR